MNCSCRAGPSLRAIEAAPSSASTAGSGWPMSRDSPGGGGGGAGGGGRMMGAGGAAAQPLTSSRSSKGRRAGLGIATLLAPTWAGRNRRLAKALPARYQPRMTNRFDVLAIGNAIVDVLAAAEPVFLLERGIEKGSMRLISAAEAETLYAGMGSARQVSGGSAANTVAGMAALGARTAFIGRVAADPLGHFFSHDIRAAGVQFATPASHGGDPTGRCLIVVTPDGDRTMSTYLGACQELSEADLDPETVEASGILYLEGYLWDPPAPRAAMQKAISMARAKGRKVAFTLSDVFCVEGHRSDFRSLLEGHVDLMFANEREACALYQTDDLAAAMAELGRHACVTVITRSEKGAVVLSGGEVVSVPASSPTRLVDTTGAGDLFAGGFMAAMVEGRPLADCARAGCIAAAEVISHFGARPEADLKALVAAGLGSSAV